MAQSRLVPQKRNVSHLPPSCCTDGLLLHPGGRYRWGWAGHRDASEGVDDWDGIAGASGGGLVELQRGHLIMETRRDKRRRRGVEGERRRNGGRLLRRRPLRGVACQG